jgi:hypothetical protein
MRGFGCTRVSERLLGFLARLTRELTSDELGKFSSEAREGVLIDPSRDFHSLRLRFSRP